MAPSDALVACHDCDLLYHRLPLPEGSNARCGRCGAVIYRRGRDVLDRTQAYALGSLFLFIVANVFPFLDFQIGGRVQVNHLATGVVTLWNEGYPELGAIVAFTSIIGPAIVIAGLLAVSFPVRHGWRPVYLVPLTKLISRLQPWSMMEVYLLGVIVSVIKLSQMAEIRLGIACYGFVALIFCLTAAVAAFDPQVVWDNLEDDS